ncbi:MAG: acetylglucosamine-6-sulfatase, partial [Bacteroidetes bacterium]
MRLFWIFPLLLLACRPAAGPTRPNILFVMADDHTAQAWGIYGGVLAEHIQTPAIQRHAEEGIVLNRAYCTNSICVPSRASILTSQYSHQNQVYTLTDTLNSTLPHLAHQLQAAGYQTGLVGKWHLKSRPAGFDYFEVLPGQGRYFDPILRDSSNWDEGGKAYEGFSADVIADRALAWLQGRKPDQPFALMVHFKGTHEPFAYPARHDSLYAGVDLPEPETLLEPWPAPEGRPFAGQLLEILGRRYAADENGRYPGTP